MRKKPIENPSALNANPSVQDRKDAATAISESRSILRVNSGNADAHFTLANLLISFAENSIDDNERTLYRSEAIAHASQAVKLKPELYIYRSLLARAYLTAGKKLECIKTVRDAVVYCAVDSQSIRDFALALSSPIETVDYYLEILKPDSFAYSDSGTWTNLAIYYLNHGNYENAITVYKWAIDMFPSEVFIKLYLADALHQSGKVAEALDQYLIAVGTVAENVSALDTEYIAEAYYGMGEIAKDFDIFQSVSFYESAHYFMPTSHPITFQLACTLGKAGLINEAIEMLEKIVNSDDKAWADEAINKTKDFKSDDQLK